MPQLTDYNEKIKDTWHYNINFKSSNFYVPISSCKSFSLNSTALRVFSLFSSRCMMLFISISAPLYGTMLLSLSGLSSRLPSEELPLARRLGESFEWAKWRDWSNKPLLPTRQTYYCTSTPKSQSLQQPKK